MINLIIESVIDSCESSHINASFVRDDAKSALFAPVFEVCVDDKPIGLVFNSAIINTIDKSPADVAAVIVQGLLIHITRKLNQPNVIAP